NVDTGTVWTAMQHRPTHCTERGAIHGPVVRFDDSDDAAHRPKPYDTRGETSEIPVGAVPGAGAGEPFFERHLRLVAEHAPSLGDVEGAHVREHLGPSAKKRRRDAERPAYALAESRRQPDR